MKLSETMRKALHFLLIAEKVGSEFSKETFDEFGPWTPGMRTINALRARDLTDGRRLTEDGYRTVIEENIVTELELGRFAIDREMKLREERKRAEYLASATPIEEVPVSVAIDGYDVVNAVEEKRAIVNAQAEEADLLADAAAILLTSTLTGMTPEEIIAETGGRSPERQAELSKILADSVVKSILGEEPAPVVLPDLPEGRCGYVLHEEIQCTLDPHEGTEHAYAPASFMHPLPFTEEKIAMWHAAGAFDECVRAIRETRDEYLRSHEEALIAIANGDTSVPDSTERARKFRDLARTVIEEYGLSSADIVHAHDAGPEARHSVAICTRFPQSDYIASIGTMIGTRIAEATGEDLRCVPATASSGNMGFMILPADTIH